MTTQVSDGVIYQEQGYDLVELSNGIDGILFDPATLGLNPHPSTMACWRGYTAVFAISDRQLVLDKLHANLQRLVDGKSEPQKGPAINGIVPTSVSSREGGFTNRLFNNHYEGLALPITYTGGILLGQDRMPGRGHFPFWQYEKVLELVFEAGVLQESFDRSQDLADFQAQYKAWRAGKREEMPDRTQVHEIMNRAFAYSYKYF